MRSFAPASLCLLAGVALVASCRAPTEVTLVLSTDVNCADLRGTSVTVGRLGDLETKAGTTGSTMCDASGQLGTLVIVPSGDDTEEVAVRIVAGLGRDPESCVPPYGQGCIVARRAIRFLPHTQLRMSVPLRAVCNGIPCGETQTCVGGACVGATIADPTQCTGDGCNEATLTPDGTPDASAPVDAAPPPPDAAADVGPPDAGPAVVGIGTGIDQGCALLATGGVKCWGGNATGELGDGTNTPRLSPVDVISLGGPVTQISLSTSNAHACVLMAGGGVKCWGDNSTGQLGDGTGAPRLAPVDVVSLGGPASQVSAGMGFSCAVLKAGNIRCWGDNSAGQLGNGGSGVSLSPVDVASLGGTAIQVAAGDNYACAILSTGAVRCWGGNGSGQLGDGTNTPRPLPVDVAALGGTATQISATFDSHTCAVLSTGGIQCWGNGTSGQLGNGTIVSSFSPVSVSALGGTATMVRVSVDNTCALLSSGAVRCWGHNGLGQHGDGTTNQHTTPVDVVSLGGAAIDLTTGNGDTCALLDNGTGRCWGANGTSGMLGDGTTTSRLLPVTVLGLP